MGGFIGVVVVVSAMWMYFESRSFQYDKGDVRGLAAMRPVGWFFAGMLLWLVAFPLYLASRAKLKAAGETRRAKLKADDRYVPKPQSKVGPVLVGIAGAFSILCIVTPTPEPVNAGAGVQMVPQDVQLAQVVQETVQQPKQLTPKQPTQLTPQAKRDDIIIDDGTYEVGTEFKPGLYRVGQYWERQDRNQNTIDNDLVHGNCPTLVLVRPTDAYVKIAGEAVLASVATIDPIASNCSAGTFLVGTDIQPGRYRIKGNGQMTYWERLNARLETIDNELSQGQLILVVRPKDFAVKLSGVESMERMGG